MVVVFALGAAVLYALASVLQHRAASEVDAEHSLRPSLITRLAGRPVWLLGVGCDLAGYGCEAASLAVGSLAVAQPLIVLGLPVALMLASLTTHRPLSRRDHSAIAGVTLGVALFVFFGQASRGADQAPVGPWLIAGTVCGAGVAIALWLARRRPTAAATFFAIATGIVHGFTAVLTKTVASLVTSDGFGAAKHWETYALVIIGCGSMLLAQSAFQAGHLNASLPAITLLPPVVGVILGVALFHEQLATGPLFVLVDAIGVALAVTGVFTLARSEAAKLAYA
jgi:drug/metabolite transporter (DMT)-like permease